MARVDFSLDDIRKLIEESELRITTAVAATFSEYEEKYDKRFDKVEHELKEIKAEVKGQGRLVGLHSEEIMELKARPV